MFKRDKKLIIIVLAVPLLLFWFIGIWFPNFYVEYKGVADNVYSAGEFGDQFGGLNALISCYAVIVVIITFIWQYSEQRKQQIENNFFKMLEFHRENSERLHSLILNKQQIGSFKAIGVTGDGLDLPDNEHLYIDFVDAMISQRTFKDAIYDKWLPNKSREEIREYEQTKLDVITNKLLNDKHILGHYFRHLYHIVKYIDGKKELSEGEKKNYGDILRAQLSNMEMALIYYNALTKQGAKMKDYIREYRLIHNVDYKHYILISFLPEFKIDESYFEDYENKS